MWLKVGSYPDRETAMEVASKFRNAGARVEIKDYIEWNLEEKYILRGKLSELEEHEEVQEWKRYAEIIRELLKRKIKIETETFEKEFLKNAFPEDFKLAEKLRDNNASDDEFLKGVEAALKLSLLMSQVYKFMSANGIEIGDFVEGTLPEDPEIVIELDDEAAGCEKIHYLDFTPMWDVNVDVLSVIRKSVKVDSLEGSVVDTLSRVTVNLIAGIEETNSLEELEDYTIGVIDKSEWFDAKIYVDAEDVFETILKALEKAGIIRISGKKVKLRK